jgi:hypothetical protein
METMAETDRSDNARAESTRLAHQALSRALRPAPDDDEHVSFEMLEAYVDRRLGPADRETVVSHLDGCPQCAQDLDDLAALRDALTPAVPAARPRPRSRGWRVVAVVGSAAALVTIGFWMGGGRPAPTAERQASIHAPAPAAASASRVAEEPSPGALQRAADPLTDVERRTVAAVMAGGRLDVPAAIRDLGGRMGTLLGDRDSEIGPVAMAPVATAVSTSRPTFRWTVVPGAVAYSVAVYDERFVEVARSPRVTDTSWTPATELPRGIRCSWQVTAHRAAGDLTGPSPPQPEARFMVLEAAAAAAAADRRLRLAGDPLALGILLANAGLVADAAEQLRKAVRSADQRSADTARALLTQLDEVSRRR